MEACRACLATENEMVPMDEAFVTAYNLLTNLNVALLDTMPQYVCQNCYVWVNYYLEFREKCITTETQLQEILLQNIKCEDDKPLSELKDLDVKVKQEDKEEENNDFGSDNAHFDEEVILNNVKYESAEDTKPKIRKCKKGKCKNSKKEKSQQPIPKLIAKFSCGLCKESFMETDELSSHVENHKNDLKCGICLLSFTIFPTLVGHRCSHLPRNQYRCHVCKKGLWNGAVSMEYHYIKEHYDGEKPKWHCKHCPRFYDTPKQLSKHSHHSHSARIFTCDYCHKNFNNKHSLTAHIRSHTNVRAFICELCGHASKHESGLRDHKIRKHAPTKVKCSKCERIFASVAARDRHVCHVTINVCPVCGLQIPFTKNLNRHMQTHSSSKPYKCSRCPAAYKSKAALRVHNNRHDGVRPVQCPYCPMKFYTQSVLLKHKRIHTGEKPFVCKVCQKGFTGNYNLKVHMKVHGEYLVAKKDKPEDGPVFNLPPLLPQCTPNDFPDNSSIESGKKMDISKLKRDKRIRKNCDLDKA